MGTITNGSSTGKVGRKELLTEDLARAICKMIQRMPDAAIPVTWDNVMGHSKKRFGHAFNRQLLAQKEWGGRKLISEAFTEAKSVQRRMHKGDEPKYIGYPRARLQKRIAELEARNLALEEALEKVRSQQYEALDMFANTRLDLRKLFNQSQD